MNKIEKLLKEAISGGLTLEIEYSKQSGISSRRIISEIEYSTEYGNEYIEAFCHLRKERRTFKISRIDSARTLAAPAVAPTKGTKTGFDTSPIKRTAIKSKPAVPKAKADPRLANICKYYLNCIILDSGSAMTIGRRYTDTYLEISCPCPEAQYGDQSDVREFIEKAQSEKKRLFTGYPLLIDGDRLIPVFTMRVEAENGEITCSAPSLNKDIITFFAGSEADDRLQELISLNDALDLNSENPFTLSELHSRLMVLRPDWLWQESPAEFPTTSAEPLPEASDGIRSRCIIFATSSPGYTNGLEEELLQISGFSREQIKGTALESLLYENFPAPIAKDRADTLEILPTNEEQKTAIENGLTRALSIVTGPPGTGKSQVVVNLTVNQRMKGGSVLFTSRNNKAVDVVEQRINRLNRRPAMIRLGGSKTLAPILGFIRDKLNESAVSQNALASYNQAREHYADLCRRETETDRAISDSIMLHNRLVQQYEEISMLRDDIDRPVLSLPHDRSTAYSSLVTDIEKAANDCDQESQNIVSKLLWPVLKKSRLQKLSSLIATINEINEKAGFSPFDESSFTVYEGRRRSSVLESVSKYSASLSACRNNGNIEKLFKKAAAIKEQKIKAASELWNKWIAVSSPSITQAERSSLSAFITAVELNGGRQPDDYKLNYDVDRILSRLMPLSCVTALSAKGRVPLTPGAVDLLIIDEASQCDIASIIPLLFRARCVVVIGDPRQLTHITGLNKSQDLELIKLYDIDPKWSYTGQSLYNLATSVIPDNTYITGLRDHHRSHADIIGFSNDEFYGGKLRVATDYSRLARSSVFRTGINMIDVSGRTERPAGGSAFNRPEAEAVVQAIVRLVGDKTFDGTIGVVTPFRQQAELIKGLLKNRGLLDTLNDRYGFVCATAHSFQGDEQDAIIFSPVISAGCPPQSAAFLRSTAQLFNVGITRARSILIVVADQKALAESDISYLNHFVGYAEKTLKSDAAFSELPEPCPEHMRAIRRFLDKLTSIFKVEPKQDVAIDKYVVDAVLDIFGGLVLDFDIAHYDRPWNTEDISEWRLRSERLRSMGYEIMRFEASELIDNPDRCIDAVTRWFDNQRDNA